MRINVKQTITALLLGLTLSFNTIGFCSSEADLKRPSPAGKIVINVPSRTLWVYQDDKLVKAYPVGVGRKAYPTPLGQFQVLRLLRNPGWENPYLPSGKVRIAPGRNNPLGTRWIGFKRHAGGEYGIHGTDRPTSVGHFVSHGCIRMKPADVEDLFDRITIGTPVEIRYDLALIRPERGTLRVVVYPDALGRGKLTLAKLKQQIKATYPNAIVDDSRLSEALKGQSQRLVAVGTLQPDPAEFPDVVQSSLKLD